MPRLIQHARHLLLVALLAPIAVSAASNSASAAPSLDPATLGMRASGGFPDLTRVAQIERELGQPLRWYVAFADRRSPEKMRSSVQGQVKSGSLFASRPNSINVVMTLPLAFGTGTSKTVAGRESIRKRLRETAAGKWDADFRLAAKSLIAGGHGNAVLRLGHEFTGSWYPWSAQHNEAAYIAAYRHIHDVMKSESSKFRFEWNAARNTFRQYGPPAYPGDRYVDIVSLDVYYEPWKGDPAPLTEEIWQRRYINVMVAHRDFAKRHGKQVAYTEWANGDIDQPRFIERMHAWFVSLPASGGGSLAYHSYFNATNDKYNLNKYPKSKAAYLRLFGNTGGTTPTSSPTTTTTTTTTTPTASPITTVAGASPTIDVPARLSATTATAYRLPATISADTIRWWKFSGPGMSWVDKSVEKPTVTFPTVGTYVLRVKAINVGVDPVVKTVTVEVTRSTTTTTPTTTAPTTTAPTPTTTTTTTAPTTTNAPAGGVRVSVRDASTAEGGTLIFKFVLSQPATRDVVVDYTFNNVSASSDDYYRPKATQLVIPKGEVRVFFGVKTIKDNRAEGDEILRLRITAASGATIDDGTAKGTITR